MLLWGLALGRLLFSLTQGIVFISPSKKPCCFCRAGCYMALQAEDSCHHLLPACLPGCCWTPRRLETVPAHYAWPNLPELHLNLTCLPSLPPSYLSPHSNSVHSRHSLSHPPPETDRDRELGQGRLPFLSHYSHPPLLPHTTLAGAALWDRTGLVSFAMIDDGIHSIHYSMMMMMMMVMIPIHDVLYCYMPDYSNSILLMIDRRHLETGRLEL